MPKGQTQRDKDLQPQPKNNNRNNMFLPDKEESKSCNHDFGNNVLLSNPPQYKCKKCGFITK